MTEPRDPGAPRFHPVGTRVVALVDVVTRGGRTQHPRGSVGVVVHTPADLHHSYRVQFLDGYEEALRHDQITVLTAYKRAGSGTAEDAAAGAGLWQRVILRCVVGSQAFGLAGEGSDTDRRGVYLPPAELHWSLFGAPEQLENEATQEAYWELQKFLVLALKANPNVLECLYTPLVEQATPLGRELLSLRECFLSRLAYQTYNGYVMSQFKKMQADLRNHGHVKWKHVMHLLRLLLSGIGLLRERHVPIRVEEHREMLLAIRRGEVPWEETERWRLALHAKFDEALSTTRLPERPDHDRVNRFLVEARRRALDEELP